MKTYTDIFGWFPTENANALDSIIEKYNIKTITEIGSFLGRSTVFFASKGLTINAIDPFIEWKEGSENGDAIREGGKDFYDKFLENIQGYEDKITIYRNTSEEASKLVGKADLIFIDGAHDYDSVKNDILLWKGKANKIICGDDYEGYWHGVNKAVDEIFGDKVKVINKRVWYVELQNNG